MIVTKDDLYEAASQLWNAKTCLMNQALIRNGMEPTWHPDELKDTWRDVEMVKELQEIFGEGMYGDNAIALCMLEAILPIDA